MSMIPINISTDNRLLLKRHFDEKYYLAAYPDVAASKLDPLLHYCTVGWQEGRNPSRVFDTFYYLRRHTDVADSKQNPLLHYAHAGEREGRATHRPIDAWRRRLREYVSAAPNETETAVVSFTETISASELLEILAANRLNNVLVVSVSHDDYAENTGGVQNLIADEQQASAKLGWQYLHISPIQHRTTLAPSTSTDTFQYGLRLGYDRLGVIDFETLRQVLAHLNVDGVRMQFIVHHMMGHAPELLLSLIQSSGTETVAIWAHDFFTVCPSYALLRNDVVFCGGPPLESPACTVCSYGLARADHSRRMQSFFENTRPAVLAPSSVALDDWMRTTKLQSSKTEAVPLGRLILVPSDVLHASGEREHPLRIAHVGARDFHKGWPAFEELALALRNDERYAFFQLGRNDGEPMPGCIRQIPVKVTRDTRTAMIEAIAENNIDVVVSWSFWPETFCFAAHEAVAGGAFVITHSGAGNVPKMVSSGTADCGIVLPDRASLLPFFTSGDIKHRLAKSKRQRGVVLLSDGTIGWLENKIAGENANSSQISLNGRGN